MKMQQRDIITAFKITRAIKAQPVYGDLLLKSACFENGGQFVDMEMANGEAVTLSLN